MMEVPEVMEVMGAQEVPKAPAELLEKREVAELILKFQANRWCSAVR
jgi:hypothetical protein